MDIRQIRYFLCVARLRSSTRAAEQLSVAQPALSRQVKLLEEELGVRLLHRHGRGVVLTEIGAEFEARSAGLVGDLDRLAHDIQARGRCHLPSGSMTLGVPISLSRQVTIPILARCHSALPDVAVRVVEGHSELIADWLVTGRVDLAILFGDHPRPAVAIEPLAYEEMVAMVGSTSVWASHASMTGRELARLPLVAPRRPHATWEMLDEAGIRPERVVHADTLVEMLGHVRQGTGVTLLVRSSVQPELATGQVRAVPVTSPRLRRAFVLGHIAAQPLPEAAEAVIPEIRATFAMLAESGGNGMVLLKPADASRPERSVKT